MPLLTPTYNLTAVQCPPIGVPSSLLRLVDAYVQASPGLIAAKEVQFDGAIVSAPWNWNARGAFELGGGRYPSGGRVVKSGLQLQSSGTGLSLTVTAGHVDIDGTVELASNQVIGVPDNHDGTTSRVWVWFSAVSALVYTLTNAAPDTHSVFLGSVTTSGGSITGVDYSGRFELRGQNVWRRTGDTGAPTDTPPAADGGGRKISFWTQTASGIFLWNGDAYFSPIGMALGTAAGGDLTGTYPNPTLIATGTAGTHGDSTHTTQVTTDTKGRVTALSDVAIAFPTTLPPSGAAGGALAGTYPNPSLAAVGTASTHGDSTHVAQVTTNAAGQVSALADVAIAFPHGTEVTLPDKVVNLAADTPYRLIADFGTGTTPANHFANAYYIGRLATLIPGLTMERDIANTDGSHAAFILMANGAQFSGGTTGDITLQIRLKGLEDNTYTGSVTPSVIWAGPTANDPDSGSAVTLGDHLVTTGAVPTGAFGSGAGTGPSSLVIAGDDTAGSIVFQTGTATSAGSLVAVTFNRAFAAAPKAVVFTPCVQVAGITPLCVQADLTTTGFILSCNLIPAINTVYGFYYHVDG